MINTVDNFFSGLTEFEESYYFKWDKHDVKYFKTDFQITVGDFLEHKGNQILNLFSKNWVQKKVTNDDVIISVKNIDPLIQKGGFKAATGNYVGRINWNGLEINIGSRFSDEFLKRMLNFSNDIYLDDIDVSGRVSDTKNLNISKYILYYLFVQSLEKAFLLGIPKEYKSINHHDTKLRGKIDISSLLKKDIPFKGLLSTTSREQVEITEIANILNKAINVIEHDASEFSLSNISHIKKHLKEICSNKFVSKDLIKKAINSKVLNNPIFSSYKKVLEYANLIIANNSLEEYSDGNKSYYGYIVNVAELFEIYITKLLRKEFSSWVVESPEIRLYENQFFSRKIIPDIVMSNNRNIVVFDTKYKRMSMNQYSKNGMGDVDRGDFFQINTYMSYFQNQNFKVLAGGLIYPMDKFEQGIAHSDNWLGNSNSKFVIDGIDFSKVSGGNFEEVEKQFVMRVEKLIQS